MTNTYYQIKTNWDDEVLMSRWISLSHDTSGFHIFMPWPDIDLSINETSSLKSTMQRQFLLLPTCILLLIAPRQLFWGSELQVPMMNIVSSTGKPIKKLFRNVFPCNFKIFRTFFGKYLGFLGHLLALFRTFRTSNEKYLEFLETF